VLLADSDLDYVVYLRHSLERLGWEVAMVDHGPAAPETTETFWDALMLDHCPEGVPRIELLRSLRSRWPATRIVVSTAYPSFRGAVEAVRAGADDYLAKPSTLTEIMAALQGIEAPAAPRCGLRSLAALEWEYVNRVLGHVNGNISAAARVLGVQRSTLQRKLRKHPPRA